MTRPVEAPGTVGGAPARWAGFLDALIDPVWMVDLHDLRIVAANAPAARLFGVPAAGLLGMPVLALAGTPQDEALWDELRHDPQSWVGDGGLPVDTWIVAADGSRHPVTTRIAVLPPGFGDGCALVSARPRTLELALREELDRRVGELEATLESTADGILVTDLHGTVQRFNRRFAELWRLPESLLLQRDDAALKAWLRGRASEPAAWARVQEHWVAGPADTVTELVQLHDGVLLECVSHPLCSAGVTLGRVTSFRDLTDRQRKQQEIERLTTTDALTGLSNRRVFVERVAARLAEPPPAGRALPTALLLVDLDRFRTINDTLGFPAGDGVLVETARRLERCIGRDDLVARVGGDEFALCLPGTDMRGAEAVARRLLAALGQPFLHDGTRFTLTGSIGITMVADASQAPDAALQEADAAMRRAKDAGRATFRFHLARHNIDLRERLRIDQAMREGLPAGDFRLHVQPQVDLASGGLVGVEALLRWRDPLLGDMPPARFIPLAEDSGFIVDLGQWVLDQATHLAAGWLRQGRSLPISVNVSALQFRQPDFVDRVALALDRAALPAALLELELTETILLDDASDAQRRLADLSALGVRLAMDDFGTGYSSLAYLKDLPLHRLKIDRSFVAPLPDAERQAAIVRAVVQMAGALRMQVVAEGVETAAQADFLRSVGCSTAQGFLFGRPMEVSQLDAWRRGETVGAPSPAGAPTPVAATSPAPADPPGGPGSPTTDRRARLRLVKA